MGRRTGALLGILMLAVGAVLCSGASANARKPQGIGIIQLGGRLSEASHLRSYSYVLIGASDFARTPSLPGTVLYYTSGFTVAQAYSNGVPYSEARAKGWLLTDAGGHLLVQDSALDAGYPDYVGDVGDPAYERAFLKDVLAVLRRHRSIDGIEIDNVLADPSYFVTCKCFPKKYSGLAAWQNATIRFIAFVGSALKSRGYYVLANASGYVASPHRDDAAVTASWWKALAPHLSGLMDEFWMQSSNNLDLLMNDSRTTSNGYWSKWLSLMNVAQSRGVDFIGVTYGSRTQLGTMRFSKGSFLLGWNGRGGALIYNTDQSGGGDPWNPAWTADLGRPVGARFRLASSGPDVWARRYSKGTVIVNPSTSPVIARVSGTQYTIAPSDAVILPR
jgi:hypothetical protein